MLQHPRFLIVDSEPAEARQKKRSQGHAPSADSFEQTVLKMWPSARIEQIAPAEAPSGPTGGLASFDGAFLSGSPLHFYEETPETRPVIDFMRVLFASGTPSFGSCAGLQIATVAAGGKIGPKRARHEAGIARLIFQTPTGLNHPMLFGRSPSFDAPAVHSDEVQELPPSAILLASSKETRVQAAEIQFDKGIFWGVQYHPEISLHEVANALKNEQRELCQTGFIQDGQDLHDFVARLNLLHENPARLDLAWQMGLSSELVDPWQRTTEVRNFIEWVVATR